MPLILRSARKDRCISMGKAILIPIASIYEIYKLHISIICDIYLRYINSI